MTHRFIHEYILRLSFRFISLISLSEIMLLIKEYVFEIQTLFLLFMGQFGEGNGTPLQYSCLENPMDGGAWWAAVHGVAKESDTTEWLHFHFSLSCTGEGNDNPLQYACLENPRDGSLVGCCLWGHTESDTTDVT